MTKQCIKFDLYTSTFVYMLNDQEQHSMKMQQTHQEYGSYGNGIDNIAKTVSFSSSKLN